MPWPNALVAILLGFIAVMAAMRARRDMAATLGREWRMRFLLVQGLLINVALFATICLVIGKGASASEQWLAVLVYGPLFYGYSLSNINWTAKKFHGVEG
ncbi:MAG: hypothetical protein JWM80_5325 [Cyanobacteria bacterium RYN_339]|nr:hypothetical protein [Cyanobacteria bacterium RYN_339]